MHFSASGGIWSAGASMGPINDIPTCKEPVERIVSEAAATIKRRLVTMRRGRRRIKARVGF